MVRKLILIALILLLILQGTFEQQISRRKPKLILKTPTNMTANISSHDTDDYYDNYYYDISNGRRQVMDKVLYSFSFMVMLFFC